MNNMFKSLKFKTFFKVYIVLLHLFRNLELTALSLQLHANKLLQIVENEIFTQNIFNPNYPIVHI